MQTQKSTTTRKLEPNWLRSAAVNYINHERGEPIRALARMQGCNPSTVLRQVRRIRQLRENPQVNQMISEIKNRHDDHKLIIDREAQDSKDCAILQCLKDRNAIVVCSENMAKSLIVSETDKALENPLMVVNREEIMALALRGVLCVEASGKVTKYRLRDAKPTKASSDDLPSSQTEAPIEMLARRRDVTGRPFLSADLVKSAARLCEDFEIGGLNEFDIQDVISGDIPSLTRKDAGAMARSSAVDAFAVLGAGLSEIAIRCCCLKEGLEKSEKTMGWSARSGKIVLRIALQRLHQHYRDVDERGGGLIG